MESWIPISAEGVYLSCFLLSVLSALVPWVNGELVLLSCTALAHSPWQLSVLVMLTSAGQMAGKCILYWTARGAIPLRSNRLRRALASWKERFPQYPSKPLTLVFISSAVGIPPFYILTVMAGILQVQFGSYFLVGTCGRLLRFGMLAAIPGLAFRFLR